MAKSSKNTKGTTSGYYNAPFAKRLRDLLDKRNKTNKELADFISVSQQAVNLYASGNSQPTIDKLVKIARFFNVSTDYLLGISDISSQDVTVQAFSKFSGLKEQPVKVIGLYGKAIANNTAWAKFFNDFGEDDEPLPQTTTELEIKALNHILANCNALLTAIGLYLFGEFKGVENVKVEGIGIGLSKPSEFMRNAMLVTITNTLANYRRMLEENGGDLPLTMVLDATHEDNKERFVKSRIEFLESVRGRSLTEEETQQQRNLYEQSQDREG